MTENNPMNVAAAFELLIEEIEAEIEFVKLQAKTAVDEDEFRQVQHWTDQAKKLKAFGDRLAALSAEWEQLAAEIKGEVVKPEIKKPKDRPPDTRPSSRD